MTACPDKELLLQGLLDGELDAANAVELESHIRGCAGCAEEFQRLQDLRTVIAAPGVSFQPPAGLRARIEAAIAAEARRPGPANRDRSRRWLGRARSAAPWAISGLSAALAASLVLGLIGTQPGATGLEDELVADHVRSLLASHLTDVATSDRHVVKPWFNGRIDFAPPVIELADRGFPLAGGRLDYVQGRVVAALVYRRRRHVINLFVRPEGRAGPGLSLIRTEHRQGYSLVRWSQQGLEFWAVSDIDAADLQTFRQAFTTRVTG